MSYYFLAWKHAFKFDGCASRHAFWSFIGVHIAVTLLCITWDVMTAATLGADLIYGVVSLVPMISIVVRRLHDIERSGWWGWVFLVPVIGPIWLICFLAKPGVGLAREEAV